MRKPTVIGPAELEVLQYIADHNPITVGQATEAMTAAKGYARNTVMTFMERLRKKGYLKRQKVAGVFQYSPRLSKADFLETLVRDFVDKALGGSTQPFVAYLTQKADLSDDELRELRQFMRKVDTHRRQSEPRTREDARSASASGGRSDRKGGAK